MIIYIKYACQPILSKHSHIDIEFPLIIALPISIYSYYFVTSIALSRTMFYIII